jgi:predicted nucleotidyltransferase
MPMARTSELRRLAGQIAAALPAVAEEVVLTGSVSRGAADDLSDIEMLVVTTEPLELAECFEHARRVGLDSTDSWGPREQKSRACSATTRASRSS